ncbi:MAG: hypothetical protein ACR2J8_04980 [Thermomicrobiales bacterium]
MACGFGRGIVSGREDAAEERSGRLALPAVPASPRLAVCASVRVETQFRENPAFIFPIENPERLRLLPGEGTMVLDARGRLDATRTASPDSAPSGAAHIAVEILRWREE